VCGYEEEQRSSYRTAQPGDPEKKND